MKTAYDPAGGGALTGLTVLDMTRLAAGNMLTHMLADFGARVIKIERPGKGDDLRRFGDGDAWWQVYARSKESLTLDFNSTDGRAILLRLVAEADILAENFIPGSLEKWNLAPDVLHAENPALIIARVSGWGQTGPYAGKPGFGSLVEGMSGFAAMNGWPEMPPLLPPVALADMMAGLAGFGGVLAAVLAAKESNKGQVVDISLFEPLFASLGPWAAEHAATGAVPQRQGNRISVAAPRNLYECADGKYLALSASMQSMWEKLAHAMGRGELIDDPRFATPEDRVRNVAALDAIIAAVMQEKTCAENIQYYESCGVTVGPICDIADLMEHPYIRGRGVLQEYGDAGEGEESIPMHQVFPRLSETPGSVRRAAPALGQDNAEILGALGYDATAQSVLRDKGVI